ncbi:MAG: winged helix-turn-helix transcriptional regulator [Methanobacteriota archaeon]|nr:MAG: winged helix-turn-helix transcriptional regulator [Euryarchaeota archaeon]
MNLDQSDLQILFLLKNNSRISLTDLGKQIGMTPAAINYRLQKLIEKGIIRSFTIDIDYSKLTPNYQSYLFRAKIPKWLINKEGMKLFIRKFFNEAFQIAEGYNFLGVTFPLDSDQLQKLIEFVESQKISEFIITPIISREDQFGTLEIRAENVQRLYCPECQKEMEGKAIVVEVNESKLMGFCCEDCRNKFIERYEKIVKR